MVCWCCVKAGEDGYATTTTDRSLTLCRLHVEARPQGSTEVHSHSRGLQISLLSYASGSFGGLKYSSMVSSGELEGVGRGVGVVVVTASGCALASWS